MTDTQHTFQSALRLHQAGRLQEAQEQYQQVLAQQPDHADALHHLGVIAHQMGQHDSAAELIRRSLAVHPDNAQAWNNLGAILQAGGHLKEAAAAFHQAVKINGSLTQTHKNLGTVLHRLGRIDEAVAAYRQALKIHPGYVDALCGLSAALLSAIAGKSANLDEAMRACRQALALAPDCVDALINIGKIYLEYGDLEQAASCSNRALQLRSDSIVAQINMGGICMERGDYAQSIAHYDRAIALCPDSMEAHVNRGMVHLLLGHLEAGWEDYQWRLNRHDREACDAGDLAGKRILLQHEQGLGDTFHFIRYASVLKTRGAHVSLECPPNLHAILGRTPGIDQFSSPDQAVPPHDIRIPMLSLPRLCQVNLQNISGTAPYVFPDPSLVSEWRQRIAQLPGFRVGIVWQGNPKFGRDKGRSIPLREFAPLAAIPGVTLVVLQKHAGLEQVAQLNGLFPVVDYQGIADDTDGFLRTAAIIANLDLVISADTSVAHLAGAMGAPVWTALPSVPDWRWFLDRDDSPWYPTMRLFRQRERGNWTQVLSDMADALRQKLQ